MSGKENHAPLEGISVVAIANGVASAYAARLLGTMGAIVVLIEPECGSPLRREAPFLPARDGNETEESALFAYLSAGTTSQVIDLNSIAGRSELQLLLAKADIFLDDTSVSDRKEAELYAEDISKQFPNLIYVSVLPFGRYGDKADWKGNDLIVQHAGGEGNLLPNGLAVEMFPDRPPLKIGGHFGEMQGGVAAALGALSALWARPELGGQVVDVSCQDAMLAVGAFAIQRLGDGSIEHRVERSFRYGGVIRCADGDLELLTLEQRQWEGLVTLLGSPDWAADPALDSSIERGRRGPEINRYIREWASTRLVDDIVSEGQKLGVPLARYKTPIEILEGAQEGHRGLFQVMDIAGVGDVQMLVSPFHFDGAPLALRDGPPKLASILEVAP